MTQEDFKKCRYGSNTRVKYRNKEYSLASVDFDECLFCLDRYYGEEDDEYRWVRCENCESVSNLPYEQLK